MIENLADYRLGEHDVDLLVDTSGDCRDIALALAQQAARSLHILSASLDPPLYNNSAFADAVRTVATAHPNNRVKILVRDPDTLIKTGHRLVDLARRLSSYVEVRKLSEDYGAHREAFLVADGRGLLHRVKGARYDGVANFNAPSRGAELVDLFDEIWQRSQQFREFRQLHI